MYFLVLHCWVCCGCRVSITISLVDGCCILKYLNVLFVYPNRSTRVRMHDILVLSTHCKVLNVYKMYLMHMRCDQYVLVLH